MRKHAQDNNKVFGPEVAETVLKNFYVDDCLKSLHDREVTINHVKRLRELMNAGGFRLTKWISNDRDVLQSIPEDERASDVRNLDLGSITLPVENALGVEWCMESDCFRFKVIPKNRAPTRRGTVIHFEFCL